MVIIYSYIYTILTVTHLIGLILNHYKTSEFVDNFTFPHGINLK